MTPINESIRLVDLSKTDEKTYAFRYVDCIVLTQDNKFILDNLSVF